MGVWLLVFLLAVCTLALGAKVLLLRRDLRVLTTDLHDHLHTDSNIRRCAPSPPRSTTSSQSCAASACATKTATAN